MSRYTPSDSNDGKSFIVDKSTDEATINSYAVGQTVYKMKATTTTTVVEFRGLSRSGALDMADSADYNYSDKHGVKFRNSSSWMAMPDCEGVVCKAQARRINEADMFRVTVTYASISVTHSGNWTKETF